MCVFNGHAVAGGLLTGFAHDFRLMKKGPFVTCLSEINIGIGLTPGFSGLVKNSLDPQAARLIVHGHKFSPEETLKLKAVDDLYTDNQELKAKIAKFAQDFAPKAQHRHALTNIKENLNMELVKKLSSVPVNEGSGRYFTG